MWKIFQYPRSTELVKNLVSIAAALSGRRVILNTFDDVIGGISVRVECSGSNTRHSLCRDNTYMRQNVTDSIRMFIAKRSKDLHIIYTVEPPIKTLQIKNTSL